MPRARSSLLAAALLAAGMAASAQMMLSPVYATYGAPTSNFLSSSFLLSQAALGATSQGGGGGGAARSRAAEDTPVYFPASAKPIAPRQLAESYPDSRRADAEQLFLRTLEGYHDIEKKFGLRRNDIGGAMAAFIAGNYIAYRDEPFPDRYFRPLADQMHRRIHGSPALRQASERDRQVMYEQLAILGTYMALTRDALQQSPNPQVKADMQRAARNYLEQFLRIDPDRMRIGPEGLVVR